MTDDLNDIDRLLTRRDTLAATATALTGGIAGCSSGDDTVEPVDTTTTTPTTTATDTTTQTTTEEPDKDFEQIYDEQLERDREYLVEEHDLFREESPALRDRDIEEIQNTDYDDLGQMMQDLNDVLAETWGMDNDSQQHAKLMRIAAHEDLGLDPDEVRVLGRDTTGSGTYTAVFRKNDEGDWIKDLALPFKDETAYLRHGETDINERNETEDGLAELWKMQPGTGTPATYFSKIDKDFEGTDVPDEIMNWIDQGNDHIVVGDEYGEPALDYTVPAAKKVEELQNFEKRSTFNGEMELVERATEAYHNSEEPYLEMRMENGEVTAVPTEEHNGPGNLYNP